MPLFVLVLALKNKSSKEEQTYPPESIHKLKRCVQL